LVLVLFLFLVAFLSIKKMSRNNQKTTVLNSNYNQEERSMPASLSANKKMNKPDITIDTNKQYQVTLHTSTGDITIALDAKQTPVTANNFIYLAQNDFYNNTIFHRVIEGFMIQGGDPRGDGTGSPGYRFDDEPVVGEYKRGTVAMANSGPNTNGSQFFIMHQDYALQPNYVIFGQVVAGLEVVDAIAGAAVRSSFSGEMSSPVEPVILQSVTVSEK
jgi:cyclophilin family peptidyl-prolyl cis-trans isomerase